jgi:signal transduction histidine kinase
MSKSLQQVCSQLDKAIEQTRTLSFDLSPSILYDLGFEVAVEDLVDKFSKEKKIRCSFKNCGKPKPLTDDVKILLYRAVRELLINAAKHSRADIVKVALLRSSNDIHVTVEDDGRGFDASVLNNGMEKMKGFGIFNIRERLNHIGGQFKIESGKDKGTKITLIAPLNLEEDKRSK